MDTEQCGDFAVNYYINLTCFIQVCLTHMNHIKLIDLFMLKLCNLNGWKIVMQLNYIKCKFRPNHFFECILHLKLYANAGGRHMRTRKLHSCSVSALFFPVKS